MKIIDIGEAFYLVSEIAYMTKETDTITGKPKIKIFLKGNSCPFSVTFDSISQRDEYFSAWKDIVVNNIK